MQPGQEFDDCPTWTLDFDFSKANRTFIRDYGINTTYVAKEASTSTAKESQDFQAQVDQSDIVQDRQVDEPPNYDSRSLSSFLRKVTPLIMKALDEDFKKLKNFQPISEVKNSQTDVLYTLTHNPLRSDFVAKGFEITDVQWNSNGLTIAACFGCLEHNGQCTHSSYICTWNITKRDFQENVATQVLETSSCIMCLAFHPRYTHILAAGGFNGEVFLFDLSTDSEIAHSSVDEYFHREAITSILWLQDESILTLGCEGKILIWNPAYQNNNLKYPLKGCYMLRKKEAQTESVGGVCISQSLDDPYTFVVGSEGGSVLKAQVTPINHTMSRQQYLDSRDKGLIWSAEAILFMENLNQKYLPEIKQQVEQYCKERKINSIQIAQLVACKPDIKKMYANPLSMAYEAHYGTVFSIHFSPFIKSAFITASMDGQIRIYTSSNARCLAIYEYVQNYILSAQFSPVRPCVFAACDSLGQVLLYDLFQDTQQQILTLKNEGKSTSVLRFNQRQQDLLACSISGQQIKVYQLQDDLCVPKEGELQHFEKLLT